MSPGVEEVRSLVRHRLLATSDRLEDGRSLLSDAVYDLRCVVEIIEDYLGQIGRVTVPVGQAEEVQTFP